MDRLDMGAFLLLNRLWMSDGELYSTVLSSVGPRGQEPERWSG